MFFISFYFLRFNVIAGQNKLYDDWIMADASQRNGRLEFLDALRGLAAFSVVVYHLGSSTSPWMNRWLFERFNLGVFAVCVFFFVSGYIIPISLQRYSVKQFWRSRFFRLVPAYWFTILLTVVMAYGGWMSLEPHLDRQHLFNWILNLSMVSGILGRPTVVSVSWTLGLELLFYILCSGLKSLGLLRRRTAVAWSALGVAAILLACAGLRFYPAHEFKGTWVGLILAAFVGSVFFDVVEERVSKASGVLLLCAFLILATVAIRFEVQHALHTDGVMFGTSQLLISWYAATVTFLLVVLARRVSYPAAVLWVGRISYSLYLMHSLPLLKAVGLSQHLPRYVALAFETVISLLVADVCYRFIERPFLHLAKGSHRREQTNPAAPILSA